MDQNQVLQIVEENFKNAMSQTDIEKEAKEIYDTLITLVNKGLFDKELSDTEKQSIKNSFVVDCDYSYEAYRTAMGYIKKNTDEIKVLSQLID